MSVKTGSSVAAETGGQHGAAGRSFLRRNTLVLTMAAVLTAVIVASTLTWAAQTRAVARASMTVSSPGTAAARSPTRMVAPRPRRASMSPGWVRGSRATARASWPGAVRMAWAPSLRVPLVRVGARVATLSPPARTPLRRRRNSEPHSSSGSRPTRRTWPALSRER